MFVLELLDWISLYLLWLLFGEFVLLFTEICSSVGFLGATETFANHLGQIGSASSKEFWICSLDCFVWLGLPSMQ